MHNPFFHRCLNVSRSSVTHRMSTLNSTVSPLLGRRVTFLIPSSALSISNAAGVLWATCPEAVHLATTLQDFRGKVILFSPVLPLSEQTWPRSIPTSVSFSDLLPYEQRMVVRLGVSYQTGEGHYFFQRRLDLLTPKSLQAMTLLVSSALSADVVMDSSASPY